MRTMSLELLIITIITACSLESAALSGESRTSSPLVANGTDFIVCSHMGGPSASEVLQRCRSLREKLQRTWLGAEAQDAWRPRCEVVLHATRASYLHAVGRGGGQTLGSSLIRFEEGRIVTRQIDLLANEQGVVSALPHELTHVVLADRFVGRQPPRWVDEGIATIADSTEKRKLHWRDCQHALRTGTELRMYQLLTVEQFTSARQAPAFYGQSLSLVHFLVEQGEPRKIVDFSEAAMDKGYDEALRECYRIDGVVDLERRWRAYAITRGKRIENTDPS